VAEEPVAILATSTKQSNPDGTRQTQQHGPNPCLARSNARRTLGVRLTLDGNNKEEATYLTSVAKEWGENSPEQTTTSSSGILYL